MSFDLEGGYYKPHAAGAPVQQQQQQQQQPAHMLAPGYYLHPQQQQPPPPPPAVAGGYTYGAPMMGSAGSPLGSAPLFWIIISVLEFVIAPFGVLSVLGLVFAVLAYTKNEAGDFDSAARFLLMAKYICIIHLILVVVMFCFAFCIFGVFAVVAVAVPVAANA